MRNQNIRYYFNRLNIAERLIVINVAIFILCGLLKILFGISGGSIIGWFELPKDFFHFLTQPWSIVTYSFFHSGFGHIFWNMIMLYFAGRIFLNLFDNRRFLNVYFLGVILGGMLFLLSYNIFPALLGINTSLIGASAGVTAVLIFVCSYLPNQEVRVIFFNVKLWHIGVFVVLLDLIQISMGGNVGGRLAHLGGAALGYFYARQLINGNDIGSGFAKFLDAIANLFKRSERKAPLKTVYRKENRGTSSTDNYDKESRQRKIDAILDKISKSGYESLSKAEKDFLFKAGKEQSVKNLNFIDKFLFFINAIFALLLFISCFVPQISVTHFAYFSILSLTVPVLVLFNLLFLTYWLAKRKRQLLLSAFVLVLGYFSLGNFFRFQLAEKEIKEKDLSIMSYNVRGFNKYDLLNDPSAEGRIMDFISSEDPDILCIQEFSRIKDRQLKKMYPFKYITGYKSSERRSIQAIYSKFVIINSGSLDFPDSGNNAIFADIVVKQDTLRLYNLHLESHRVSPSVRRLSNEPKGRLLKRLSKSFAKQGEQAQLVEKHMEDTSYRKIVCGDFNNTQFSNVYKVIKGDMKDSFSEQGTGYGRTFNFRYYPVRIDFILADEAFEIAAHKNFDIKLSDHFPVMASIKMDSNQFVFVVKGFPTF